MLYGLIAFGSVIFQWHHKKSIKKRVPLIALQMLIEHKGGNRFNIPHIGKDKREKLLPKT